MGTALSICCLFLAWVWAILGERLSASTRYSGVCWLMAFDPWTRSISIWTWRCLLILKPLFFDKWQCRYMTFYFMACHSAWLPTHPSIYLAIPDSDSLYLNRHTHRRPHTHTTHTHILIRPWQSFLSRGYPETEREREANRERREHERERLRESEREIERERDFFLFIFSAGPLGVG